MPRPPEAAAPILSFPLVDIVRRDFAPNKRREYTPSLCSSFSQRDFKCLSAGGLYSEIGLRNTWNKGTVNTRHLSKIKARDAAGVLSSKPPCAGALHGGAASTRPRHFTDGTCSPTAYCSSATITAHSL